MTVVQKLGSSLPSGEVVGYVHASRCLHHPEEGHASVGHRGYVKPVLEVS